jgi:hypothetical protein
MLSFWIGGAMAMRIRAELIQPGLPFFDPLFYKKMIIGAVMPAFVGLASWQIPLMIVTPDKALPRRKLVPDREESLTGNASGSHQNTPEEVLLCTHTNV